MVNHYCDNYIRVLMSAWAEDFAKAIVERPKWMRPIIKLLIGRYAFREFVGFGRIALCIKV